MDFRDEAYNLSKQFQIFTQAAGMYSTGQMSRPIISNVICVRWPASGANTAIVMIREGVFEWMEDAPWRPGGESLCGEAGGNLL